MGFGFIYHKLQLEGFHVLGRDIQTGSKLPLASDTQAPQLPLPSARLPPTPHISCNGHLLGLEASTPSSDSGHPRIELYF